VNDETNIAATSGGSQAPFTDDQPWLPGFAGELEKFIYFNSFIPIRKVAQVATLGVLAGVCGRGWCTHTDKDLALYLMLVANSGIGKDGIHDGIPKLLDAAGVIGAKNFVKQIDYVSGQAMHAAILNHPGFLNLQTEWGRKLKGMADNRNTPMQSFRTTLTKCYGARYLEGKGHASGDNSLGGVVHPAFSFLGETTPGTFSEALSVDMSEDGLLSRFLTVTYSGERPPSNPNRNYHMHPAALEHWRRILQQAMKFQIPVMMPPQTKVEFRNDDTKQRLDAFEEWCRVRINAAGDDQFVRAVYNRAHLKVSIVASLLAVADWPEQPKMDLGHEVAAELLVKEDIEVFLRRQASGEIGSDDHTRLNGLDKVCAEYLTLRTLPRGYRVPEKMHRDCIIPRKYIQVRLSQHSAFRNHRLGALGAMDLTVKAFVQAGYFMEVDKAKLSTDYNSFRGTAYLVLDLPSANHTLRN
jgi:hypothetical protein